LPVFSKESGPSVSRWCHQFDAGVGSQGEQHGPTANQTLASSLTLAELSE
jgi:hypothetical protein